MSLLVGNSFIEKCFTCIEVTPDYSTSSKVRTVIDLYDLEKLKGEVFPITIQITDRKATVY